MQAEKWYAMRKIYFWFACLVCCCAAQAQEGEIIRIEPEWGEVKYVADTVAGTATAGVYGLLLNQTIVVQDTIHEGGHVCVVTRFRREVVPSIGDDKYSQYAEIYLPKTIRRIDEEAFDTNEHLRAIHVAEDNPYYTSIGGVLYDKKAERLIACPQAKTDTLVLPYTVKKIRDKAFFNCHELKYIEVEEGNKTYHSEYGLLLKKNTLIAYPAKRDGACAKEEKKKEVKKNKKGEDTKPQNSNTTGWNYIDPNFTNFSSDYFYFYEGICHIPSFVHAIAPWAITCSNMYRFEVEDKHKQYTVRNGVLYSKNEKTLVMFPGQCKNEHVLIPEGVTAIAPRAFFRNRYVHEVTLPTTLKKIGTEAFAEMNNLRHVFSYSLRVPQRGKDVFREAYSLQEKCLFVPTQVEKYYPQKKWSDIYVCPLVFKNQDPELPPFSVSVPDRLLVAESASYDLVYALYPYSEIIEHVQVQIFNTMSSPFCGLPHVREFEVLGDDGYWGMSIDGVLFSSWDYSRKRYNHNDYDRGPDWNLIAFPPAKTGDYAVPDSVVDIVDYAFANCHLSSLTISDHVSHVDQYINESDIEEYVVTPGNQSYYAIDGVLFNRHGWMRAYPQRRQDSCYTVPMGTIGLSVAAFMNNKHLREVHITDSVQTILSDAFHGCDNLTAVYIHTVKPPFIFDDYPIPYKRQGNMVFPWDAKIYVPEESLETYKTNKQWKPYANRIFPMKE